nr:carbamoyltransferase HypF [uncultured Cohaesibacter sp.]
MTKAEEGNNPIKGNRIRVNGLVQGVGFRPTVWRLAQELDLRGDVRNDGKGVLIRVWGSINRVTHFCDRLKAECPPLARIDRFVSSDIELPCPVTDFSIVASEQTGIETAIIPDAATCSSCLEDVTDPTNRRYRYPFTNCTHCGPRLTIIKALPYDRANTAMSPFVMCPHCAAEYDDPADRRFHAQPNACPECGPAIWLTDGTGEIMTSDTHQDCLAHCAALLSQGRIVAIKGLGGFHLACDATNQAAVETLRRRKRRPSKPLALMARDVASIEAYCHVRSEERQLLTSAAAPIVLLDRLIEALPLADAVAPGQNRLGFMVPNTPLHHLLLGACDGPLVMTSGNLSNDPQITDNEAAIAQLATVADHFLLHDRDIINRVDDSVAQLIDGKVSLLRRARGYAPDPLPLPDGFDASPVILAAGGELKNSFCLLAKGHAVVSHHIGDMEVPKIQHDYRKALSLYLEARKLTPDRIAIDDHPTYLSSRLGADLAERYGCALLPVQHHHAHVAACMVEHGLSRDHPPVLGIALDGLGAGDDGTLWGGEILLADYATYRRLAHFDAIAMPGGNKASVEPWRNCFAHLHHAFGWKALSEHYPHLAFVEQMKAKPTEQLITMLDRGLNAPLASSAGRLFDAVAAFLSIGPERQSYEGEAASLLQMLAETASDVPCAPYPVAISAGKTSQIIGWKPMWQAIIEDCVQGVSRAVIARRFHMTLIDAIAERAIALSADLSCGTIVLTGGCIQNRLLAEGLIDALQGHGLELLIPRQYPANDGGLSLGQAIIATVRQTEQSS